MSRLYFAFATVPAEAATVGAGPYYATPSWDQTLPSTTRFIVLSNMGSAAVLDRETGLVWEQSPSSFRSSWDDAKVYCNTMDTGGRVGWRLPSVQELASLVDPTAGSAPFLPSGHPFGNVQFVTVQQQPSVYWTATTYATGTSYAWGVDFNFRNPFFFDLKSNGNFVWCVRGGSGADTQ